MIVWVSTGLDTVMCSQKSNDGMGEGWFAHCVLFTGKH